MKKLVLIAAAVVAVVVGLVALIPVLLSSDSLRTRFAAQMSDMTGAEIALNGPVRFSLIPDFGIVAEDIGVTTSAAKISVKRAVAGVRMGTILSDRIRITGIALEQPRILLLASGDSAPSEPQSGSGDVFKAAAGTLEGLSIDRITVTGGMVSRASGSGTEEVADNIELTMAIPGVDEESSFALSARTGGREVTAEAAIAAIGALLAGNPTALSLAATMSPPPHPALEDVAVKGTIQLAADGSYRIADGAVTTLDQPMRLDAAYLPGDQPSIDATIRAGELRFSDFQASESTPSETDPPTAPEAAAGDAGLDLSALTGFDANLELSVDSFSVGDAKASGLKLVAVLINGLMDSTLTADRVAGGKLSNRLLADFSQSVPEFQGAIRVNSARVGALAGFVGASPPVTGTVGTELQYAFLGTSAASARNSLNLAGRITLDQGVARLPVLAETVGEGADTVSEIGATATITDIESPIAITANMVWNGERVNATANLQALEYLTRNRLAAALSVNAAPIDAQFNGAVEPDGALSGTTNLNTASLSRLLAWFGQDIGTPLGPFSYSGGVSIRDATLALEQARISLDGMTGGGSATFRTAPRPAIEADLAFDQLDMAFLTGGAGAGRQTQESETPIDLAMLRAFDADISLRANKIGYGKVVAGPAAANLTVRDGVARLDVPPAGFYSGAVEAKVVADGSGDIPAIDLDLKMESVDALPLFDDAADFERVEGKLNAAVATRGTGRTTGQLAASLGGNARFRFTNGALRGIDIAWLINNMRLLFATGYVEDPDQRTEFTELSVTMDIKDGIATTNDVKLLGPLVRMDGAGQIALADQTIEMRLNPKLVGSLEGQGGAWDVSGLEMPVIVTGTLADPKIYPDLSRLLTNPDTSLRSLAAVQEAIKGLGDGNAAAVVKQQLGAGGTDDIVSGLVDRLAGGSNGTDVLGSVIGGLTGRKPQSGSTEQPDSAAADDYPIADVPVPTPNPRRSAAAEPVAPAQEDEPASLTDQVVDTIVPKVVPEEQRDAAGGLVKGLLDSLGRQ